jgi:cytochrome c oxidase subunit 2
MIDNIALSYVPLKPFQLGFQDPVTPVAEGISAFHNDLRIIVRFILSFVVSVLHYCIVNFNADAVVLKTNSKAGIDINTKTWWGKTRYPMTHGVLLETLWTSIPAIILLFIVVPSFSLLYGLDETIDPIFNFKVIGHQWYWSYEFMDTEAIVNLYNNMLNNITPNSGSGFDSYLISEDELYSGNSITATRLLTVDNHLYVVAQTPMRARVTSADVLHSWAVPSLGVKVDACPGRLNQVSIFIKRQGIYYGQCSEICGVNHGFMPIGIVCQDIVGADDRLLNFADYEAFLNAYNNSQQE